MAEPRFVYRPDHPFGPNIIDRQTGKWMGMELVREYVAVAQAALSATGAEDAKDAEIARLLSIINTPQADDFLRAVSTEAEHQRQRWGSEHDAGKTPADWFWLVGYLAGKALHSHAAGNLEKAEHHVVTTAAACANWHRAMFGKTDMRPGIDSTAEFAARTQSNGAAGGGEVSRGE